VAVAVSIASRPDAGTASGAARSAGMAQSKADVGGDATCALPVTPTEISKAAPTFKPKARQEFMKKYQIVSAQSIRGLIEYVNIEIAHGWKPTGGLATVLMPAADILQNPQPLYLQAMIHKEGNDII